MKIISRYCILALFALSTIGAHSQSCVWTKIAANNHHTLAIKTDGSLWAWGNNEYGQLGDRSNVKKNVPVQIGTDLRWASIATGYNHSFGIKSDGTLWAWGNNLYGQLGDKTYIDKNFPTKIGTDSNWAFVASGWNHTLAIKTDGTLWTWGLNNFGQLGDGTTTNRNTPTQIGTDNNWAKIVGGGSHSIGLKTNGNLWSWGNNSSGQLGDASFIEKHIPTQDLSGTLWQNISTSYDHNIGLKTDGTLWTWGSNNSGQLGDGTKASKNNPSQIGYSIWKSAAASQDGSLAIKADGSLWGWGSDQYGQIGDGSTLGKKNPVQVGTETRWVSIFAGSFHSIGLKDDGGSWLWGNNDMGQLGDGSIINKYSPQQISNGDCNNANLYWIADDQLRAVLKAEYPSCFNSSDYLNTACAANSTKTSLNVSNRNISNMDGIQYFSTLKYLNCSGNNLTQLSALPGSLTTLIANQNCFCANTPTRPSTITQTNNWQVLPNKPACRVHFGVPASPITTDINTATPIIISKYIYLNGTNSYIDMPAFSMAESPITIEFWAKQEPASLGKSTLLNIGNSNNGIIISSSMSANYSSLLEFNYGGGGAAGSVNLIDANAWNHYAITSSGKSGNYAIYINRVLINSGTLGNTQVSLQGLKVGTSGSNSDFYKGYIHDLSIWKKVRSADEIQNSATIFNDYLNPDLIGYWKILEGNGTIAKDLSTKRNQGIIMGGNWSNSETDIQYVWSPATYLSSTTGTTPVFNSPSPQTYSYTISASKVNGCTSNQTLNIAVKNNIGNDFAHPIQAGQLTYGAVYSNTQNNNVANGFKNDVGQASDDIFYAFTLTQNANVTISHCSSTLSDTYMHLFNSNRTLITANDDYGPSCTSYRASISTNLTPGIYYVASEGFSYNSGDITTEIKVKECVTLPGTNLTNPIVIGNSIGSCFTFNDFKNNGACFGNEFGQSSDDIFYKFTLNSTQTVTISNCGSEISDSYMTILDANGNVYDFNDDSPVCAVNLQSYLQRDLAAGTYYIVEEGYSNTTGYIRLSFKTGNNCRLEEEVPVSKEKAAFVATETEVTAGNLSLYPNPASDVVNLNLQGVFSPVTISVKDISGRVVKTAEINTANTEMNVSDLSKGMYFVSFYLNGKNNNIKLEINR